VTDVKLEKEKEKEKIATAKTTNILDRVNQALSGESAPTEKSTTEKNTTKKTDTFDLFKVEPSAPAQSVSGLFDSSPKQERKNTNTEDKPKKAISLFDEGSTEKCLTCGKTVFLTEKISAEGKVFHQSCFRCSHCNSKLKLGSYAGMNGVYYCKPHFKQLFMEKGNYAEGFGAEKPTAKWQPQVNTGFKGVATVLKESGEESGQGGAESRANEARTSNEAEKETPKPQKTETTKIQESGGSTEDNVASKSRVNEMEKKQSTKY